MQAFGSRYCYSHASVFSPLPEGSKRLAQSGLPLWFATTRNEDRGAKCWQMESKTTSVFISLKVLPLRCRKGSRKWRSARAVKHDESVDQEDPPPSPVSDKKAAARAEIQKGQTTAIITGAISVLLGVGYLVLLQLLDTRGVNLVAPPPEAFDP